MIDVHSGRSSSSRASRSPGNRRRQRWRRWWGGIRMQTCLSASRTLRITGNSADVNGVRRVGRKRGPPLGPRTRRSTATRRATAAGIFARASVVLWRNDTVAGNSSGAGSFRAQVHMESGVLSAKYATITADSDIAFLGGSATVTVERLVVRAQRLTATTCRRRDHEHPRDLVGCDLRPRCR
ncbi:MAG: hypothetical protein R2695_19475 [Acidimicrobiales bacterium]